MICPACSNRLSPVQASGLTLDVCREGCGGIWFDANELEKIDEESEHAPDSLLRTRSNMAVALDRNKKRKCPKCADSTLQEHYHDGANQLEVDTCPQCSGVWLDFVELAQLRDQNEQREVRTKIIDDYTRRYEKEMKTGSVPKRMQAVFKLLF